ncbi:condensation domain-containing protein [Nonomuraea montanisoli]|nr:condensation domain-containing protein [Nonomuraea montanisoli]
MAPLSHGQLYILRGMERHPPDQRHNIGITYNLDQVWTLPPGITAEGARDALVDLAARNEVLRTTYHGIGEKRPRQVVHAAQTVELQVLRAAKGDGAALAAATADEQCVREMDLTREFSWRAAVVLERDGSARLALCFHHIAVDLAAIELLRQDLHGILQGAPGVRRPSPRAVAEYQTSPGWAARDRSATAYFDGVFQRMSRWTQSAPEGAPTESVMATLRTGISPATMKKCAVGHATSATGLLLAVFTRALCRLGAMIHPAVHIMSANRFDPLFRGAIANQAQFVPIISSGDQDDHLEVQGERLHRDSLLAYRNGCYNPDTVRALREAKHGLDAHGEPTIFFNYAENASASPASDDLGMTELSWAPVRIAAEPGLYGYVWGGRRISLILRASWPGFGRDRVEQALRLMHEELVSAISRRAQ